MCRNFTDIEAIRDLIDAGYSLDHDDTEGQEVVVFIKYDGLMSVVGYAFFAAQSGIDWALSFIRQSGRENDLVHIELVNYPERTLTVFDNGWGVDE